MKIFDSVVVRLKFFRDAYYPVAFLFWQHELALPYESYYS